MSLLDDASIVVTPNGYKQGVLFSVIPSSGAADLEVTRGTAATRVDENGLVNYAEVIGGEEVTDGNFPTPNTAWDNQGSWTISGNSANYDALNNARYIRQAITLESGKTYNFKFNISVGVARLYFGAYNGSNLGSGGGSSYINYSIGEHSIYITTSQSSALSIFAQNTNGGQAFSLSELSIKEVTRDNVPRIDYTGGGCPHILAEPQRTNLCLRSQEIDNATWTKQAVTVSANSIASPDGNSNADSIVGDGTSGNHYILQSFTVVSSEDYTVSIFAKAGTNNFLQVILGAAPFGSSNYCNFDLLNGNIGSYGGTSFNRFIEPFGNGWYRLGFTATALSSGSANFFPTLITSSTSVFLESNTLDTSIEVYGCSLEVGSYATSYIPTSGSTVTRNQDIFTRDGIGSLINSTEGVLFLEVAALSDDGTNRYISINDGNTSNYIYFRFVSTSNTVLMRTVVAGGTINTLQTAISDTTAFNKFAFKWKSGDYAFWINGVESLVDASATIFSADVLNTIEFSFPASGGGGFPSKVKQLQVYKTALTDDTLALLTS